MGAKIAAFFMGAKIAAFFEGAIMPAFFEGARIMGLFIGATLAEAAVTWAPDSRAITAFFATVLLLINDFFSTDMVLSPFV
jgi:hypothetical protein